MNGLKGNSVWVFICLDYNRDGRTANRERNGSMVSENDFILYFPVGGKFKNVGRSESDVKTDRTKPPKENYMFINQHRRRKSFFHGKHYL